MKPEVRVKLVMEIDGPQGTLVTSEQVLVYQDDEDRAHRPENLNTFNGAYAVMKAAELIVDSIKAVETVTLLCRCRLFGFGKAAQ